MLGCNDFNGLKILVTGATHGLGRNAVAYLLDKGAVVRATGRDPEVAQMFKARGVDFILQDLTEMSEQAADDLVRGMDMIWHCAARSSPWGAYQDFYAINVAAPLKLAQSAYRNGVKGIIHISTPSIYFDFTHRYAITEDDRARRFVNHYAATKMLAETALLDLSQSQRELGVVMLRPRAIFGPHDRVLLPRLLSLLADHHNTLMLPRKGQVVMDVTYVGNVIHAMALATVKYLSTPSVVNGQSYNISNGSPITLKDLLDGVLNKGLHIDYRIKSLPYGLLAIAANMLSLKGHIMKKEPPLTTYGAGTLNFDMTLDITKAQQDLAYSPQYSIEAGITQTLPWAEKLWRP